MAAQSMLQPALLQPAGPDRAQLSGDLTHKTVVDVLPQGLALLQQAGDEWTVSLQGVGQVSSAGVALLLEWLRAATALNKALYIECLPEHMEPIIRISDLEPVFSPLLRPAA